MFLISSKSVGGILKDLREKLIKNNKQEELVSRVIRVFWTKGAPRTGLMTLRAVSDSSQKCGQFRQLI